MPIAKKEKELAAVGISIAAGCKPCTDYHMKAVREAGASDDEIERAIEDAVAVRNTATSVMRDYGRSHLGGTEHEETDAKPRDRLAELVGIGAAFAVNCVSSLENYSRHAKSGGVTRCTAPGFSDTRQRYAASCAVIVAIQYRLVSAGLR